MGSAVHALSSQPPTRVSGALQPVVAPSFPVTLTSTATSSPDAMSANGHSTSTECGPWSTAVSAALASPVPARVIRNSACVCRQSVLSVAVTQLNRGLAWATNGLSVRYSAVNRLMAACWRMDDGGVTDVDVTGDLSGGGARYRDGTSRAEVAAP